MVLCAGAVFASTLLRSTIYVSGSEDTDSGVAPVSTSAVTLASSSNASAQSGVPARLRAPSIGLDANVVDVGVAKSGNMAVPYTYTDAGWYRYGPKPGETGSTVIDGHVDNGLGGGAVFERLSSLKPGDDIYIDTKDGATLHFKVEEAQTYDVADVPLQKVFNRSDQARLNLITCDGTWEADQKMYDKRHIVYAVLQSS